MTTIPYGGAPTRIGDLDILPVFASIELSSTCDHTDVFVCLCDVHPDGQSFNVCDGLHRLKGRALDK